MKYIFANYPTETHLLKIGSDTLEIVDGIAEVDDRNPALVTLAEVYGGKPLSESAPAQQLAPEKQPKLARAILTPKKALASAMQSLNNQVKSVAKWSGG